jgi:hypothetical protein
MTFRPAPKPTKPIRRTKAALAHLARVAALPCVVCGARPVHVHHCIHGRYAQRKASDLETLPLCDAHHTMLHASPGQWQSIWGRDFDLLPVVAAMLEEEDRRTV